MRLQKKTPKGWSRHEGVKTEKFFPHISNKNTTIRSPRSRPRRPEAEEVIFFFFFFFLYVLKQEIRSSLETYTFVFSKHN